MYSYSYSMTVGEGGRRERSEACVVRERAKAVTGGAHSPPVGVNNDNNNNNNIIIIIIHINK